MQRYIIILSLLFLSILGWGQNTLSTHFMRDIWQSNTTNPSFVPDSQKVFIALPNIDGFYNLSRISLSKAFDFSGTVPTINLSNVSDAFKDKTYLKANTAINVFSLGIRFKDLLISFDASAHVDAQFVFRKGLLELMSKGNAPFIGKAVEVGPSINLLAYSKIGVGAAYQLGKLSLGVKLNALRGFASIDTEKSIATITTSDDIYQMTAKTDYIVHANAQLDNDFNIEDFSAGNNNGFGLDLGASYDVTDKLSLALSITDIGSIKFKDNTSTYVSNGSFTFEGVQVDSLFSGGAFSLKVNQDSIIHLFKVKTTTGSAYTQKLPTKVYLSGFYDISDKFQVGALYHLYNYGHSNTHAIQLSGRFNWKRASLGATYGIRDGSFDNLGLNLALKLGPIQFYALTDNVLTIFNPIGSHGINLGLGANIAW